MIDVSDDEFGVGYVYQESGGIKPLMAESEWRVTQFEPTPSASPSRRADCETRRGANVSP